MRFIDYDKTHYAIYKKLFEYTPPALRDDYMLSKRPDGPKALKKLVQDLEDVGYHASWGF